MITQTERVLAELRRAGGRGVTGYDFSGPRVIDGGDRIMRVAARILELRKDGHAISKLRSRRDGHDVYVLEEVGVRGQGGISVGESLATHTSLFELPPPRPLGAYESEAA